MPPFKKIAEPGDNQPSRVATGVRQAEQATPVPEVWRKMGISEQTFYRWNKRSQGMWVAEVRPVWVPLEGETAS